MKAPKQERYVYFVSYNLKEEHTGGFGFGSTEVIRNAPIRTYADVNDVRDAIIKVFDKPTGVVVLNWILLEG